MQILIAHFQNDYILGACMIILFSFLVSYKLYPIIIHLSYVKNLFKIPEQRSSHMHKTPTMGGVGIFFGFTLTFSFIGSILNEYMETGILLHLIASLLILFFIGVKDDLLVISPLKKLIAQLLASTIIIIFSDTYITSFYGILGINELPYFLSLIFTFFAFVLVINAYNLIDGIDGLAGSIALLICIFFGLYFLINEEFTQMLISFSLMGPLIAFLIFNVSPTRKIFMGDTGTMIIGFIIMYQSIIFLEVNQTLNIPFPVKNAPIFILAVLSLPLTDVLRVFIIRIKNGKSPFKPDRNHIHHCFLDSGLTHIQATSIIVLLSLVVMLSAFLLQDLEINLSLFIIVAISCVAYLSFIVKKKLQMNDSYYLNKNK